MQPVSLQLAAPKARALPTLQQENPCAGAPCRTSLEHAMVGRLRRWAEEITRDVYAIYLARHDPRVPWYAKALAICVAGYALSPIDLIPDFVPVLGYMDDIIIVPLGILIVVKLIPPEVWRNIGR